MNAWDIYTFDPGYGDHPAVIISEPNRVANKPLIEILLCSSQRPNRAAKPNEVLLDTADGLSWETLCKCDLILAVDKSDLHTERGSVTPERRKQIVRTMIAAHGWNRL
ncbi:MAG TPA: type II toxin-antitoxin system PemK/MazF family toxin [Candidatus Limnocylindrales bacterium]|nr:type II toxin-antitoxin system PemK/MazF family toxin [Candidatus Limnocylindrales bacterium]